MLAPHISGRRRANAAAGSGKLTAPMMFALAHLAPRALGAQICAAAVARATQTAEVSACAPPPSLCDSFANSAINSSGGINWIFALRSLEALERELVSPTRTLAILFVLLAGRLACPRDSLARHSRDLRRRATTREGT